LLLVFVPARKGSKGIPRKNIQPLCGIPLVQHTFEFISDLQKQPITDEICPFVYTDDENVTEVGDKYGFVTNHMRPPELSGDSATIVDGILDSLVWLSSMGVFPDSVLLLQPTSPLRNLSDFMDMWKRFKEESIESIFSVIPMKQHPTECIILGDSDKWRYLADAEPNAQRQSYGSNYYFIDGSYYLCTVGFLKRSKCLVDPHNSVPFILKDKYLVDIDEPDDLKMAETLFSIRRTVR
jgi:CMP-N,N'-diacetyllegionaminic acid synthase